ncbi:SUMF1/EgtB/PvdO family nonheme iron enzyme [Agrilutibacter solisilvae]
MLLLAACTPDGRKEKGGELDTGKVTIGADQSVSPVPPWRAPAIEVTQDNAAALRKQADAALAAGRLHEDATAAIPLYLALSRYDPEDESVAQALTQALGALLDTGRQALVSMDHDRSQLRRAHEVAAVARVVAPSDRAVDAFLDSLDRADEAARANRLGEAALAAARIGERGQAGGAIGYFREALERRPGDARARQGLAAAESALIRRAERSAAVDNYDRADYWLVRAAQVREGADTVPQARERIALQRAMRVNALRDAGIAELGTPTAPALRRAREHLAELLRIAPTGDAATMELRTRIERASHYGLFSPGAVFTDSLPGGSRAPRMVVIPHGAFSMGAADGEADATDAERPTRNIRFDRGIAMSRTEITVGEFRRFVEATGHRARAVRRGYSTIYDERSGNFVRAGNVDWRSDYVGRPAADDMPVLHVSVGDAMAYAQWLSDQTGHRYRLPSEAEFEYALRAGSRGRFPWGESSPPRATGNFTGAADVSPSGRRWSNAFGNYGDGAWGPAPVARYDADRHGVHDLAGNVSEWVADCWHSSYRRAPKDGRPWVNPGCRTQVVRGGSWASSPANSRSAWRQGTDVNNTNARVGFRVVRDI